MCYNCGCQMPKNDMGNLKNITNKTFKEVAVVMGISAKESKKNTLELLEKVLAAKEQKTDK